MAPETGTALLILVAFVLPGFATLFISERTYTVRRDDSPFERLLQASYYAGLTYAIVGTLAWLLGFDRADVRALRYSESSVGKLVLTAVFVVFVVPFLIAHASRLWHTSSSLRPRLLGTAKVSLSHSTASGWEHFFESGADALVRVTLTDGRVVGGYYGGNSFAGYTAQTQDLFLEERWELDEDRWFVRPARATLGVWIPRESIVSIELYDPPPTSAPDATMESNGE